MLDAIYWFISTPLWDITMVVLMIWGAASLFVLIFGLAKTPGSRLLSRAGVAALLGSVIFSMVFEDFLPGLQSGRTNWANAAGMGLIVVGICLFVYGGFIFVRDTFRRLEAAGTPVFGRQGKRGKPLPVISEHVPVRGWLAIWTPALLALGGGFGLIIVGASLNNSHRFPLAWLWGPLGI